MSCSRCGGREREGVLVGVGWEGVGWEVSPRCGGREREGVLVGVGWEVSPRCGGRHGGNTPLDSSSTALLLL